METPGLICARCLASPPQHDLVLAAVSYAEIARDIALKLKHGRKIGLARVIARHLEAKLNRFPNAILVPVPLHRRRLWQRGFNQSVLIARSLARSGQHQVATNLIYRRVATPMLGGLGARERAKAVRGAFMLRSDAAALCKGKTFILIDDVYTSGATTNACARLLKKAGAAQIHVICWARVLQRDDETY